MGFLNDIQLDIMLILSGVCLAVGICGASSGTSVYKKRYLFIMDISSALLMISDRFAYIYRGDTGTLGFWMVRICNFLVFLCTLIVLFCFNGYMIEMCRKSTTVRDCPIRLKINEYIISLGVLLLIISQFTGLYYTFDEFNRYRRADGFIICYLIPLISWSINFSVLVQNRTRFDRRVFVSLILFCILPIAASIAQLYLYGLSLTNIAIAIMAFVLRYFELRASRRELALANQREKDMIVKQQESAQRLFEQTATALVNAIDAKDKYTHGHSARVAEYSRKLAEMSGKPESECDEIYYSALVHDVGKIGVPKSILSKDSRLTDEEYATIKQHPVMGVQILESISEFPSLSIGAHYHHERYDGKGYPEGLKGTEIPEMARIIAVADAYDAMTSKRSYRDPIPQQKVREEIVKGSGTQFDPEYARLMLHLIDDDLEYQMSEREVTGDVPEKNEFVIGKYRSAVFNGILLTPYMTTVTFSIMSDEEATGVYPVPSMILFDSLDGKAHFTEKEIKDLNYFEYGEITFDLKTIVKGARKIESQIRKSESSYLKHKGDFKIEAARIKDHAIVRIYDRKRYVEFIIALPDSTRYLYLGLTGEHCCYTDIETVKSEQPLPADYIPRIAEEISYIKDAPVGDMPNVQIDDYRTAHSEGVPVKDGLRIRFHAKCLPTARLVWHCPFVDIFCSDDGVVNGSSYRDLAFMRFDGECWECDTNCHADLSCEKGAAFEGWDAWKKYNRDGYDAEVRYEVRDGRIAVITENAGISIRNEFTMTNVYKPIYTAITGDQVAITDIRVDKAE